MKKSIQNIIQILLIIMSVSVLGLKATQAQPNSYAEADIGYLVKIGSYRNHDNSAKSSESFVCNGNIVMAPEVIKNQLSCMKNDPHVTEWVQLLLSPSAE